MFNNPFFWIALFLAIGIIVITIIFLASRAISIEKYDEQYDEDVENEAIEVRDDFPPDVINVPGRQTLFFSCENRIVYQMYEEDDIEFLEPFISNNHLCMYIDGKVIEADEDRLIAIVHTSCLPK